MWRTSTIFSCWSWVVVALGLSFPGSSYAIISIVICGTGMGGQPGYDASGCKLNPAVKKLGGNTIHDPGVGDAVMTVSGTDSAGNTIDVYYDPKTGKRVQSIQGTPTPTTQYRIINSVNTCPNAALATYFDQSSALAACASEDFSHLSNDFTYNGWQPSGQYGYEMSLQARNDPSHPPARWYIRPPAAMPQYACPDGWILNQSGSTPSCSSPNPPYQKDGNCRVVRSGNSFFGDPLDPDCATIGAMSSSPLSSLMLKDGSNQAVLSSTQVTTTEPGTNGTTNITNYTLNSGDQYGIVTGASSSNYNGTGSGMSSTPNGQVSADIKFPSDYAREQTQATIANDLAPATDSVAGPTLDSTVPTIQASFQSFFTSVKSSPIVSAFAVTFPSGGTCPAAASVQTILGVISFSSLCGMADTVLPPLGAAFIAVYVIAAIRIFASA